MNTQPSFSAGHNRRLQAGACLGNAALRNAPVSHGENTLVGDDSMLPVQDEVLTSQGKPFKWGLWGGLSLYLQAHHLEILALLYCMVAKILLWYQHLFATLSTDYMLGTGNHTNTINCNSIMTTSLGLGRTDQALTQHNPNMIVVDSAFTPSSISLSTLTFLWETTSFHCRLS